MFSRPEEYGFADESNPSRCCRVSRTGLRHEAVSAAFLIPVLTRQMQLRDLLGEPARVELSAVGEDNDRQI